LGTGYYSEPKKQGYERYSQSHFKEHKFYGYIDCGKVSLRLLSLRHKETYQIIMAWRLYIDGKEKKQLTYDLDTASEMIQYMEEAMEDTNDVRKSNATKRDFRRNGKKGQGGNRCGEKNSNPQFRLRMLFSMCKSILSRLRPKNTNSKRGRNDRWKCGR